MTAPGWRATQVEALLEAVPDALVGVDDAGLISFVNRQTETLFGYDRYALIGSPLETLVPESLQQVHTAHREGYVADLESRAMGAGLGLSGRRRDGTEFPVDIALSHFDTAAGPLVIAAVRDLTGRSEVEETHTLRARLAAIVEYSDDAIFSKTLEGIIMSWNPAAERIYGYCAEEIIGKPAKLLIPQGRTGESEAILAMIRAGQPFEGLKTTRVRKDGTTFPVSLTVSPIRDTDGAIVGASAIVRDITNQTEAFAGAQRMASIVEHSADAIIGMTLDGIITTWNPAGQRMFGYSSEEMIAKSVERLSPLDRIEEIRSILSRIRAGQLVEHVETIRVRKDGTVFPVSLTVSPIRDAEGVLVGASTIAHDVSGAKVAQLLIAEQRAEAMERLAELDKANADLLAVNKAMQGFIDIAAHDLCTPLSSIVGFSDILAEGWTTLTEERKQKFSAVINRQSHSLAALVNDLLTLSSLEGGTRGARAQAVVLGKAISECLEQIGVRADGVSVSCPPDQVVWADPTHLARIIDNYVQNALKYGGPPVRVEATPRDGAIEIRVIDHGPGVPPEFVPRLFEKFALADSWGTGGRSGAGLGLSIVRSLTRVNGGQALYEPIEGGGSCFIVRLPLKEPHG